MCEIMRATPFLFLTLLISGCNKNNGMEDVIFDLSGVKLDKDASLLASESDCCSFTGDGNSFVVYQISAITNHETCDYLGAYSNARYQVEVFEPHLTSVQVCVFDQRSNRSHTQVIIQGDKIMAGWSNW